MKIITIAGNIGKDAEVRNAGQSQVTGWTVAVDDGFGDKKRTIWFDCNWWGNRGVKVSEFIRKGEKVTVSGELSTREHDGKTYLTVNVNDVKLQGGNSGGGSSQQSGGNYDAPDQGGGNPNSGRDLGEEIPFAPEWRI